MVPPPALTFALHQRIEGPQFSFEIPDSFVAMLQHEGHPVVSMARTDYETARDAVAAGKPVDITRYQRIEYFSAVGVFSAEQMAGVAKFALPELLIQAQREARYSAGFAGTGSVNADAGAAAGAGTCTAAAGAGSCVATAVSDAEETAHNTHVLIFTTLGAPDEPAIFSVCPLSVRMPDTLVIFPPVAGVEDAASYNRATLELARALARSIDMAVTPELEIIDKLDNGTQALMEPAAFRDTNWRTLNGLLALLPQMLANDAAQDVCRRIVGLEAGPEQLLEPAPSAGQSASCSGELSAADMLLLGSLAVFNQIAVRYLRQLTDILAVQQGYVRADTELAGAGADAEAEQAEEAGQAAEDAEAPATPSSASAEKKKRSHLTPEEFELMCAQVRNTLGMVSDAELEQWLAHRQSSTADLWACLGPDPLLSEVARSLAALDGKELPLPERLQLAQAQGQEAPQQPAAEPASAPAISFEPGYLTQNGGFAAPAACWLMYNGHLSFAPGDINWDGQRHHVHDVHITAASRQQIPEFMAHAGSLADPLLGLLNTLAENSQVHVARTKLPGSLLQLLPPGDLDTFALFSLQSVPQTLQIVPLAPGAYGVAASAVLQEQIPDFQAAVGYLVSALRQANGISEPFSAQFALIPDAQQQIAKEPASTVEAQDSDAPPSQAGAPAQEKPRQQEDPQPQKAAQDQRAAQEKKATPARDVRQIQTAPEAGLGEDIQPKPKTPSYPALLAVVGAEVCARIVRDCSDEPMTSRYFAAKSADLMRALMQHSNSLLTQAASLVKAGDDSLSETRSSTQAQAQSLINRANDAVLEGIDAHLDVAAGKLHKAGMSLTSPFDLSEMLIVTRNVMDMVAEGLEHEKADFGAQACTAAEAALAAKRTRMAGLQGKIDRIAEQPRTRYLEHLKAHVSQAEEALEALKMRMDQTKELVDEVSSAADAIGSAPAGAGQDTSGPAFDAAHKDLAYIRERCS